MPSQPQRQRRRAGGAAAAKSGNRGLLALVEEAARLQQLTRLAQLGRKEERRNRRLDGQTAGEAEGGEGEEGQDGGRRLRLKDLQLKGTDLFADLQPPPGAGKAEKADMADEDEAAEAEKERAASHRPSSPSTSAASASASTSSSPSVVLSSPFLLFSLAFYPGEVRSAAVEVHNGTEETVHFEWREEGGQDAEEASSASPFLVSHPSHYLLPHSSLSLCVTFAPPSCGLFRRRLRLVRLDEDEEEGVRLQGEVELTLEGVSRDPTQVDDAREGREARRAVMQRLHADTLAVVASVVGSWTHSVPPPPPPPAAQRLLFFRANRSEGLHFHPALVDDWWAVWQAAVALHRPLSRPAMQWDLSVACLRSAIDAVPLRHRLQVPALTARVDALAAASRERPPVHPVRAELLSSLLQQLGCALPAFADSLRRSLHLDEATPWERRAAERRRAEETAAAAATSVPATPKPSTATTAAVPPTTSASSPTAPPPTASPTADSGEGDGGGDGAPLTVSAVPALSAEEERLDAEWRERSLRCGEELRVETAAVLSSAMALFASAASPEGSDAAPSAETVDRQPALPRPFRCVVVEAEAPVEVADSKKGSKGKVTGKAAQGPKP